MTTHLRRWHRWMLTALPTPGGLARGRPPEYFVWRCSGVRTARDYAARVPSRFMLVKVIRSPSDQPDFLRPESEPES